MSFCTQCGHNNVAEARFCEECGTPLIKPVAIPAASAPTPASVPFAAAAAAPLAARPVTASLIMFAAIGVVALIAIGAGLFFLLAPEAPNTERFAAAIKRSLATNRQNYKPRYCLS